MAVKVIADPGSCHCGDIGLARQLIDAAHDAGAWAVKFQLFPKRYEAGGNIVLPEEWFVNNLVPYAREKGIEIFASVFSMSALDAVVRAGCKWVKFAYGYRNKRVYCKAVDSELLIICSGDFEKLPYFGACRLFCVQEYPVRRKLEYPENLFTAHFNGFSDHTLGTAQTKRAIDAGARYIEKHLRLNDKRCDAVPDGKFAVRPKQLKEICDYGR
jgi:N,N'-diacetyllegionaminate synthase